MIKDKGKKGKKNKALFTREWWDEFLDKQGFYVVLLLCVAVIGITAIYTRLGSAPSKNDGAQLQSGDANTDGMTNNDETVNMVPDFVQRLTEVTEGNPAGDSSTGDNSTGDASNRESTGDFAADASDTSETSDASNGSMPVSPSPTPIKSQLEPKLTWPLSGEILKPYSGNKLVYSDTLREYGLHSGIDICGQTGETVTAAFSGIVEEAYTDLLLGNVVVLLHDGGVRTKYIGLSSISYVTPSASISQGQVIGTLGAIPTESSDGPHLHFEMTKDGDTVDPRLYLEKIKS